MNFLKPILVVILFTPIWSQTALAGHENRNSYFGNGSYLVINAGSGITIRTSLNSHHYDGYSARNRQHNYRSHSRRDHHFFNAPPARHSYNVNNVSHVDTTFVKDRFGYCYRLTGSRNRERRQRVSSSYCRF